jgi:hypothetical protein
MRTAIQTMNPTEGTSRISKMMRTKLHTEGVEVSIRSPFVAAG